MSINVGLSSRGKARSALSLTLSDDAITQAEKEWGGQSGLRLRWTVTSVMPGRYRLVFFPCQLGNLGHFQYPGGGQGYLHFHWSARDELALIADIAGIREQAVDYTRFEGGALVVEVRRPHPRQASPQVAARQAVQRRQPPIKRAANYFSGRRVSPRKPKLPLKKEPKTMQTEAIYEQKKTTSGSVCFAVVEGDLSLGVLYVRKDSPLLKGGVPKRIRVQVTSA